MALVMMSIIPITAAQPTNANEQAANNRGAQIRMEQLQVALEKRINVGEEALASAQNITNNTTTMENALDDLRMLHAEVNQYINSSNLSVSTFVQARQKAAEITTS